MSSSSLDDSDNSLSSILSETTSIASSAPPAQATATLDEGLPLDPPQVILQHASNFLSDEDASRCLDFEDDKLPQIEDYINHVEDEHLIHDSDKETLRLLKNVKTKVKVHRDWLQTGNTPSLETSCCDPVLVPNMSNRFLSVERVEELRKLRANLGMYQIRDDHPPFTVERPSDQLPFIEAMVAGASIDPYFADEDENLTSVEKRAYKWALAEPALIPYWMNERHGLPKTGKPVSKTPWYRTNQEQGRFFDDPDLPDYLAHRQALLREQLKIKNPNPEQTAELWDILYLHEPADIKRVHDDLLRAQNHVAIGNRSPHDLEYFVQVLKAQINPWIATLRSTGIVLLTSDYAADNPLNSDLPPGVWRFKVQLPSAQARLQLAKDEARLKELLHEEANKAIPQPLRNGELRNLLAPYLEGDTDMNERESLLLVLRNKDMSLPVYNQLPEAEKGQLRMGTREELQEEFQAYEQLSLSYASLVLTLVKDKPDVQLRYRMPGQLSQTILPSSKQKRCTLYRLWEPEAGPSPVDAGRPGPELKHLEIDINISLAQIAGGTDGNSSEHLKTLLGDVMPELLRKYAAAAKYGEESKKEHDVAVFEKLYSEWLESIAVTGVQVRVPLPGHQEISSSVLIYRSHESIPADCSNADVWATRLNAVLAEIPEHDDAGSNPENEQYYTLLKPLQYPTLWRLDQAWRAIGDARGDQPLKKELKRRWIKAFFAWIKTFQSRTVELREEPELLDTPYPPNDPSVVYYRGPICEADIDPNESRLDYVADFNQGTVQQYFDRRALNLPVYITEAEKPERLICYYWQPGIDYRALSSPSEEEKEAFQSRLSSFIQACSVSGFMLLPLPANHPRDSSKKFFVHDPSIELSGRWAQETDIDTPDYVPSGPELRKQLEDDWIFPQHFYQLVFQTESRINQALKLLDKIFSASATTYDHLRQLLYPFMDSRLRKLEAQMRSARGEERKSLVEDYQRSFMSWIKVLQLQARKAPLTIRDVEVNEDSEVPYPDLPGVLIFRRPLGANLQSSAVSKHEAVPQEFVELEAQINFLLRRYHYVLDHPDDSNAHKLLSWEDDDELRRLLYAVMEPEMSRVELIYRIAEEKYRAGLLTGFELTRHVQESEKYRYHHDKWVAKMPRSGIKLANLTVDSKRENGIYYIMPKIVGELPSKFKSGPHTPLPEDIVINIKAINEFVSNEENIKDVGKPDSIRSEKDIFHQMLSNLWLPTRDEIVKQYMETTGMSGDGLDIETDVLLQGQLKSRLELWGANLSRRLRFKEAILEIYEPIRGKLTLRERSLVTKKIVPPVEPDVVSRPITSWQEAIDTFKPLYEKVRNQESLTFEERTEVLKYLHPSAARFPPPPRDMAPDDKSRGKDQRQPEQTLENLIMKEKHLATLWRTMAETFSSELKLAVDHVQHTDAVEILLQHDDLDLSPIDLSTPLTEAEITRIEIEINNMLHQSSWHHHQTEQELFLNFLLRPFLQGDLRQLMNEISVLVRKARTEALTVAESLALKEYSQQFHAQFRKWKADVAKRGIILDDGGLIRDHTVLESVVGRYRKLLAAIASSRRPGSQNLFNSADFQHTAAGRLKSQFKLLESYLENTGTPFDKTKLALNAMPRSLRNLHNQLIKLKIEAEELALKVKKVPDSHFLQISDVTNAFVVAYLAWFSSISSKDFHGYQIASKQRSSDITDFSGMAERRGVQRAAIELGLNLSATNQEQHRPLDRFRKVRHPPEYQSLVRDECPLWLPLKPHERPLEMKPFEYAGIIRKCKHWKDYDYSVARERDMAKFPHEIPAPLNYYGPTTLATEEEYRDVLVSATDRLQRIHFSLLQANSEAPRRLLRRLLELIDEGMRNDGNDHPLLDGTAMTQLDFSVLQELAGSSWRNDDGEYNDIDGEELALLREFEADIKDKRFWTTIPYWETGQTRRTSIISDDLRDQQYDDNLPSLSYSLLVDDNEEGLLQRINAWRLSERLPAWSIRDATKYLTYMAAEERIHFAEHSGGAVARVPPNGHPENKYVVSEEDAKNAPYIQELSNGGLLVQYDHHGNLGTPIHQPNKYEYLQRIAFRLGRDIGDLLHDLTQPFNAATRAKIQADSLERTEQGLDEITTKERKPEEAIITLQRIALDLHKLAPDLAAEKPEIQRKIKNDPDSLTEEDAATLIQMELIQEINNNWETRFSEDEHVWDLAAARVNRSTPVPQYFSMKRWPPEYQDKQAQKTIADSGPTHIDEGQQDNIPPNNNAPSKRSDHGLQASHPQERHTGRGQPPHFPFGETPFQQAYLSFRMEQDLLDVEEFNPKPPRDLKSRILAALTPRRRPPPAGPTARGALPEIHGWTPRSVSVAQKRADVLERALAHPDFPDAEEAYFTPAEMAARRRRKEAERLAERQEEARRLVEGYWSKRQWFGRVRYEELTEAERREAWAALGIDGLREVVRTPPPEIIERDEERGVDGGGGGSIFSFWGRKGVKRAREEEEEEEDTEARKRRRTSAVRVMEVENSDDEDEPGLQSEDSSEEEEEEGEEARPRKRRRRNEVRIAETEDEDEDEDGPSKDVFMSGGLS